MPLNCPGGIKSLKGGALDAKWNWVEDGIFAGSSNGSGYEPSLRSASMDIKPMAEFRSREEARELETDFKLWNDKDTACLYVGGNSL